MKNARRTSTLSKAHTLIAMPTQLNHIVDVETSAFCASVCARSIASWLPIPSRTAEDGRTALIKSFLNEHKKATHLLFLDADTSPDNRFAIERLLSHNKDVVAGVTPCYISDSKKFRWSVRIEDKESEFGVRWLRPNELPNRLFKAEAVGGTTILIKRHVLEKMSMPYQFTVRDVEGSFATTMSEDIYFSKKIQSLGFDIWVDPTVECHHRNMIDLLQMMKMIESLSREIEDLKRARDLRDVTGHN